jgi:hypothetical protein
MEIKYLVSSVAVAASLAFAMPVWAQAPQNYNPATPGATGLGPPTSPAPTTSATPPVHHPMHAMHHPMHHMAMHKAPSLSGDATAALNREELARIQAGNTTNPPAPPPPAPMPAH